MPNFALPIMSLFQNKLSICYFELVQNKYPVKKKKKGKSYRKQAIQYLFRLPDFLY